MVNGDMGIRVVRWVDVASLAGKQNSSMKSLCVCCGRGFHSCEDAMFLNQQRMTHPASCMRRLALR
eukprot:3496833-Amphidinium_carterae.1